MTFQSDVAPLRRVLLKHPRDAFGSAERIAEQWRGLHYLAPPDLDEACREADALADLLTKLGVEVCWAPPGDAGLDSLYVRDAAVVCDAGAVACSMGKTARRGEPAHIVAALGALGVPVVGRITGDGRLEGGDLTWLSPSLAAVGRGYRTNAEGIRQLRSLLPSGVEVLEVPLPHWRGPDDVFHLMSMLSPVAEDVALVYGPLLPVPFRERLLASGFRLVEVPDEEFDSMACNVLATAPGVVVALEGNPVTARRLADAGVEVRAYRGEEISRKGSGGPTCLTRPLERG